MTTTSPRPRTSPEVTSVGTVDPTAARNRTIGIRLTLMAAAAIALSVTYQFAMVQGDWDYVMGLRLRQLIALVVVGAGTGVATLVFQTVTHNRILTPGIMGFDALFRLVQTLFVWFFGSAVLVDMDVRVRFLINVVVMSVFAVALYRSILRRTSRDLFVLVLIGIVLGTLFSSLTLFASRLLSPNDYLTVQDLVFTSFNTINPQLLAVTVVCCLLALLATVPLLRQLDVIALGRDSAITLGLDYRRVVDRTLLLVTVLVATSTALVGPMALVGLIVANLARQLLPTYRHSVLALGAALTGIIVTVGGQFLAARILHFTTTLTVVINLLGGIYFIWLILREADS